MTFSEKLICLRRQRGWSQEELGNRVGVTRQTVSKWELGETTPELEKLVALAELFDCSIDALCGRDSGEAPVAEAPKAPSAAVRPAVPHGRILYEYVSPRKLFGLPLVHIKIGYGPCLARGIFAVGNAAVGGIAIGGLSVGLVSFGGGGLGLLSLGGIAAGLLAIGGFAIGQLAIGGLAIGVYAMGGCALAARVAAGGTASGVIAIGDQVSGQYRFLCGQPGQTAAVYEQICSVYPHIPRFLAELFSRFCA